MHHRLKGTQYDFLARRGASYAESDKHEPTVVGPVGKYLALTIVKLEQVDNRQYVA